MRQLQIKFLQSAALAMLLVSLNACRVKEKTGTSPDQAIHTNSTEQSGGFDPVMAMTDKNIRSIFQDNSGNYWFGTNGTGVYRYDSKSLQHYSVKDGLSDNQILSIQQDARGNIWFGTGLFGVCKFDGLRFTIHTDPVKAAPNPGSLWKSTNDDLWFCAGGGVFRYSNSSFEYFPLDASESSSQVSDPYSLSRYGVYSICKDTKGNVWFGTQAEGVCRYDGKVLTWFKEKGLAGPAVLGLFEDSKGMLWFGNNGAGLFRYDGKTLINFTEEKGLGNPDFRASGKSRAGTLARVYCINEDNQGNIWIGTVDSGVWKYDGKSLTHYTTSDGLTSNAVNTIYKDKNGELWFGTDDKGIFKFNGEAFAEFRIN